MHEVVLSRTVGVEFIAVAEAKMILEVIRRRLKLFGLVVLLAFLVSAVLAGVVRRDYVASAEVVLDPVMGKGDPEATLAKAAAWLRSTDAARGVARSLGPAALRSPDVLSVRQLVAQVSVERIPQTYALQVSFAANNPQLAAIVANTFAAHLASPPDHVDPVGAVIRIVSAASADVPEQGPATWVVLAAGALVGIVLGVSAVVIAERRSGGLTSGADVKSRLNLYHLGNVPLLCSVLPDAQSPIDVIIDAPVSGFAEAFRGILVAARQTSPDDAKVFAITSAVQGEGRSTTAACLARSAALAGEKVVLVECDARRGAGTALTDVQRGPGLVAVLRGDCKLDDALVADRRSGAWVLPSPDDDADLSVVDGNALIRLFEQLRSRFDRVFVDTAPISTDAGIRPVLPLVDAVIMIVRWRATPVRIVRTALEMVSAHDPSWSGVVLSQVDVRKQARYGDGDASAYYQQVSAYYS